MLGVLAAVLMQAAPGEIEKPQAQPVPVVTKPIWLHTPSSDDIARAFPVSALREGLEGQVSLNCAIDAAGRFEDCRLADGFNVEPERFLAAALTLSKLFKMKTIDGDGHQVAGARMNLPIAFWMPVSAELSPVHVPWDGPRAVVVIDCRTNQSSHPENCVPYRTSPFSPEARAAALEVVKELNLNPGASSPVRAHVSIYLDPKP